VQAVPSDNVSSCSPENGARSTQFLPQHFGKLQARGTYIGYSALRLYSTGYITTLI